MDLIGYLEVGGDKMRYLLILGLLLVCSCTSTFSSNVEYKETMYIRNNKYCNDYPCSNLSKKIDRWTYRVLPSYLQDYYNKEE